jgi:magnesium transporter
MPGVMQITAYVVDEGRFVPIHSSSPQEIPARALWVDVVDPSREEVAGVAEELGLHLELDDADLTFEVYGHVEVEGDQIMIVMQVDGLDSVANAKGMVLVGTDRLVTFRNGSVPAIEAAASAAADMKPGANTLPRLVIKILSTSIDITSRALDAAEAEVHRCARTLFRTTASARAELDLENLLSEMGRLQTQMVALRYRHSLIARIVEILRRDSRFAAPEIREDLALAAAESVSVGDFASSVDEQSSRLMDSTIGFIGLRQNASARWFSIVATVFMPPTLLGAIWGMNFKYMPELDNPYAYALALTLMLLSATAPLWIVHKMGWLRR